MPSSIQSVIEAIGIAAVPTTTAGIALLRYRTKNAAEKEARTQLAINAAQQAASAARAEEKDRTNQLIGEKQATVDRLDLMLRGEQRDNDVLRGQNSDLQTQITQLHQTRDQQASQIVDLQNQVRSLIEGSTNRTSMGGQS